MQELLAKQKEIAEKFNAQQIEQDKLRHEYEKVTAVIQDRQAGMVEAAPEAAPASVDPTPEVSAVTVEKGT
tara:strand:- start:108 stop:320 length:213 start_codon:yes stop_codon:yes gene_type:complete